MAEKYGLSNLGFLTLTFADHVTDIREAQRRFNSLATNVLKHRYQARISVVERQKSGRIHFHLLVALTADIRTGFDFSAIKNQDYKSANKHIRAEWAFWRKNAKEYGFGRTELFPIKSTEEGIGRYMGKYLGKHVGERLAQDKGAKLVSYSAGAKYASSHHSSVGGGSRAWRAKVGTFAQMISEQYDCPASFKGLSASLGPRWSWMYRDFILSLPEPSKVPCSVPF